MASLRCVLKMANMKSFDKRVPVTRAHIKSRLAGICNINNQSVIEIFLINFERTEINRMYDKEKFTNKPATFATV